MELRKATVADAEAMTDVFFSAFGDETLASQCFPRTPKVEEYWIDMLREEIGTDDTDFLVVTHPGKISEDSFVTVSRAENAAPEAADSAGSAPGAGRRVIAFAQWRNPKAPFPNPPGPSGWPADGDPELAARFFGTNAEHHRKHMGDRPHWYLELIATSREWQGRGAAGRLLRWGLERADEVGVECFLEGTTAARGMYEKYGYVEVQEMKIGSPGGDVLMCYMKRDARPR